MLAWEGYIPYNISCVGVFVTEVNVKQVFVCFDYIEIEKEVYSCQKINISLM